METILYIRSSIRFWNYSTSYFMNSVTSDQDVIEVLSQNTFPDKVPVDDRSIFGNSERDPDSGLLTSAQMFNNAVALPSDSKTLDLETTIIENVMELRKKWEEESNNIFRLEVFAVRSFDVSTRVYSFAEFHN